MEFQVSLSPRAERDLENIGRYLAHEAADAETASRFCDYLVGEAESLHLMPQRGHPVTRKPGIRKLVCGNYLIFYKIDEARRAVEILRFWHGAQDRRHLRMRETAPAYAASV